MTRILLASIVIAGVISGIHGNWQSALLAVATVVLLVLPFFVESKLNVYVPTFFSLCVSAFLYATIILGQVDNYYAKYWWWDVMLHSGSGLAFGIIGLVVLLIFLKRGAFSARPLILSLFAFCFALAIGLLWEVFEFSGDVLFHTNMQQRQTGVTDTMKDEIMDTVGAFLGAGLGYLYLRSDTPTPLDAMLDKTIKRNRKKVKK